MSGLLSPRFLGIALLVGLVLFLAVVFLGSQVGPCACPVPVSSA